MNGSWRGRRERGSSGAIRLIIWLALHAGRNVCRVLLVPICAYFLLTAPLTRRSSLQFLSRARGHPANWPGVFRHLFVFATTLLDRVYLLNGRMSELEIQITNEAAFWNALAAGRGCLLLGSHLGSFEMLGIVGSVKKKLPINIVMHIDDSARLRGLIQGARSSLSYNVIQLGQPGSMLRVKECLDRGEVVGILADRVYADEATQILPFLGSPARFSLSPLRLAKIAGAPVVAVFGLFRGGRRYEIVFESLAGRVIGEGETDKQEAQNEVGSSQLLAGAMNAVSLVTCHTAYVACLEHHARRDPENWFNFYDYWSA